MTLPEFTLDAAEESALSKDAQHSNSDVVSVSSEEKSSGMGELESREPVPSRKRNKKKNKVKQRQHPDAPRRFKSAYMFFSIAKQKEIRENFKAKNISATTPEIAKMVSKAWKGLSEEGRKVWTEMAFRDKARYLVQMHEYNGPMKIEFTSKAKALGYPKRPNSSFFEFRKEKTKQLKIEHPNVSATVLSTMVAKMWKELDESTRQSYIDAAKEKHAAYYKQVERHEARLAKIREEKERHATEKVEQLITSAKGGKLEKLAFHPHSRCQEQVSNASMLMHDRAMANRKISHKVSCVVDDQQKSLLKRKSPLPVQQPAVTSPQRHHGATMAAAHDLLAFSSQGREEPPVKRQRCSKVDPRQQPPSHQLSTTRYSPVTAFSYPRKPVKPFVAFHDAHYEAVKRQYPVLDEEVVEDLLDRMWEEAPMEERAFYRANYSYQMELYEAEMQKLSFRQHPMATMRNNNSPVVLPAVLSGTVPKGHRLVYVPTLVPAPKLEGIQLQHQDTRAISRNNNQQQRSSAFRRFPPMTASQESF